MALPSLFRIPFEKHRLANGLTVIVHENRRLPQAAVDLWYHVGSKDERPGRTGLAHLFEHMMFQGTLHCPGDFFRPLEEVGARLNGSTSEDRTNYWEVVPSEYLDRALFLEADRMGWLLPALTEEKFQNQREVVKNERRQTVENEPYGVAEEVLLACLYPEGHPYHHPVIGSMEDLDRATLEDVKAFFRRYYTPNNAVLCVAGNVSPGEALEKVERYFGEIPPGPPVSPVAPWIPTLARPVRAEVEDRVQLPRLTLAWPTACHLTSEDAALSVLAFLLATGKDSRLQRRLLLEEPLAQSVWCGHTAGEVAGALQTVLTARPGVELPRLEESFWDEIREVQEKGVSEEEVRAAVEALTVGVLKRLQTLGGFGSVSDMLNYYEVFTGDPAGLETELARYAAVTPDAVVQAARRFLSRDRHAAVAVLPPRARPTPLDRSVLPGKGKEGRFAFPEVRPYRLATGREVWILKDRTVPLLTLGMVLLAGSAADPPGEPGLAFFTAGLLDEAAAGQDALALARRQKALATSLSTRVDPEKTVLSLTVQAARFQEGLSLLADVLLRPEFREQDVERVRQEHRASLLRRLDEAPEVGGRALKERLFGKGSPFGHPPDGFPEVLDTLTGAAVRDFYGNRLRPARSLLVAVGDVEEEAFLRAAEALFGEWALADRLPLPDPDAFRPAGGLLLVDKPGAPQAYLTAGMPALARTDERDPAFLVFNAILGGQFTSRINMNLRERRGLTYGAHAYLEPKPGVRPWVLAASVEAERTAEALSEALREIERAVGEEPPTEEEFQKARENLVLRYPQNFETQAQLAAGLSALWAYDLPLDYHGRLLGALQGLDLEAVRRAGREVLRPRDLSWVVVGDRRGLEGSLKGLGLSLEIQDPPGKP
jgi:zinc protease